MGGEQTFVQAWASKALVRKGTGEHLDDSEWYAQQERPSKTKGNRAAASTPREASTRTSQPSRLWIKQYAALATFNAPGGLSGIAVRIPSASSRSLRCDGLTAMCGLS